MSKISAIIVTWNSKPYIADCIRSLQAGMGKYPYEVIVCDNASSDGTADFVAENFKDIRLIRNQENLGFSRANNRGYHEADCNSDFILFINPDTQAYPQAIERMVDFLKKDSSYAACGPLLLDESKCPQRSTAGYFPTPARVFSEMFFLSRLLIASVPVASGMYAVHAKIPTVVDYVSGACILIKKEVLAEVGLFDEKIFMYAEDMDLCLRIRKQNKKVFFLPEAIVLHYQGKSLVQQNEEFFKHLQSGFTLVIEKQNNRFGLFLIRFFLTLGTWMRIVVHFLSWKILGKRESQERLRIIRRYLQVAVKPT